MGMEQLISHIVTAGNIAVLVLMVGCGALYKMYREDRKLERDARTEDAKVCAASTDRQTEAVRELTKALVDLRLDSARRGMERAGSD